MKLSRRVYSNLDKEEFLNKAIVRALKMLSIPFQDIHTRYNFYKRPGEQSADFVLYGCFLLEAKNWNCVKYYVDRRKSRREILYRFIDVNNPDLFLRKKILVISNPRWTEHSREYLMSHGIEIIELGYFVDENRIEEAAFDIATRLKNLVSTLSESIQQKTRQKLLSFFDRIRTQYYKSNSGDSSYNSHNNSISLSLDLIFTYPKHKTSEKEYGSLERNNSLVFFNVNKDRNIEV